MRKKLFNFSVLAGIGLLVFGSFGMTACSDDSAFKAAEVRLSSYSLSMEVGKSTQLRVSVSPKNYANERLDWYTSNENVATVNSSGYVFAVGEGTATVTATIAGGRAQCTVNVTDSGGGGGGGDVATFSINPKSLTVQEESSKTISATVTPLGTNVTFIVSDGAQYVSLTQNGLKATVTGVAKGKATITVTADNGKPAQTCKVEVTEKGGGGGGDLPEEDIGVPTDLGYSGSYVIGYTPGQANVLTTLISEFNRLTHSSIIVTGVNFPEDKTADTVGQDSKNAPHIFPYASDQTLRLYQGNYIAELTPDDAEWILETMGEEALLNATLKGAGKQVGFPFASDNGYVMYYDKSRVTEDQIDTLPELFAMANALDCDVNYDPGNGFYGAGLLMSYSDRDLYDITVKKSGSYTAKGHFSEIDKGQGYDGLGLKGAKAMATVYGYAPSRGTDVPIVDSTDTLATIYTTAAAAEFKRQMGSDKYGVAPLPYISEEDHTRLGVYLGYKFLGINAARAGDDYTATVLTNICKFLTSAYAQKIRYQLAFVKPTVLDPNVLALCENEPHIQALNRQIADGGTVSLGPVDSKLWDGIANCAKSIKDVVTTGVYPDDATLLGYLGVLDVAVKVN